MLGRKAFAEYLDLFEAMKVRKGKDQALYEECQSLWGCPPCLKNSGNSATVSQGTDERWMPWCGRLLGPSEGAKPDGSSE